MLFRSAALQKSLAAAQSITLGNAEAMAAARTMLLSRSLNALKAAFMSNPIGLIAGLLASVAASMMLFSDNTEKAAEMTTKYGDRAATVITRVNTLSTTLNGLTSGTATHKKVMDELNSILEDYGLQTIKEGDSIDTVNEKRTQAIELIKQEAIERQRLNAIEQGMNDYTQALNDARNSLFKNLQGAETGGMFAGLVWSLDNSEIQDNAAAISTIISQVVESNITEIAGKTGDEYEKGLQKIYSTIQDRMRAIGISEKTISKEWFDDGFFIKTDLVGKYISAVQSAKEANDTQVLKDNYRANLKVQLLNLRLDGFS